MSAKGFAQQPSIKFIADLYGKDSIIYMKKLEVQRLRAAQIGVEEPPINWIDVATHRRTEIMNKVLGCRSSSIASHRVVEGNGRAMNKYFMTDYNRKINAILVMQNVLGDTSRTTYLSQGIYEEIVLQMSKL